MSTNLRPRMLNALKQIYRSPVDNRIHMRTADALIRRGLAQQGRRYRTWGLRVLPHGGVERDRNFPHEQLRLTAKGRLLCQKLFE